MSRQLAAEKPTQVLKIIEVPNTETLERVLDALHVIQLKYDVACYHYDSASTGKVLPRFTVTVYVQ